MESTVFRKEDIEACVGVPCKCEDAWMHSAAEGDTILVFRICFDCDTVTFVDEVRATWSKSE